MCFENGAALSGIFKTISEAMPRSSMGTSKTKETFLFRFKNKNDEDLMESIAPSRRCHQVDPRQHLHLWAASALLSSVSVGKLPFLVFL
ncbi:hypothetical protein CEXT_308531 [Caerostris extrusa]|uniref:Uncharacterized protein n=1 Tax=Caerostris extrusa TaxID=172846 RepID=A0AAV4YB91_CAEEX|nr:hypothetical protein CEXT_308531 [Caerostris extrusa]